MPPDPPDPGLGVFETLLVRGGRAQAPAAHLGRLAASVAELYAAELPAALGRRLGERVAALDGERRLRVEAIPGPEGLRIAWRTSRLRAGAQPPVRCRPAILAGGLGRHKWCDRRPLDQLGARDGVALIGDLDGNVLEAGWANLWLIEGRRLITPPADSRLLAGVTRGRLLGLGPALGLQVAEEPVTAARLQAADGLFLTSSLRQAVGAELAGRLGPGPEHPAIAGIRAGLDADGW